MSYGVVHSKSQKTVHQRKGWLLTNVGHAYPWPLAAARPCIDGSPRSFMSYRSSGNSLKSQHTKHNNGSCLMPGLLLSIGVQYLWLCQYLPFIYFQGVSSVPRVIDAYQVSQKPARQLVTNFLTNIGHADPGSLATPRTSLELWEHQALKAINVHTTSTLNPPPIPRNHVFGCDHMTNAKAIGNTTH